jgi:hypothetical protein
MNDINKLTWKIDGLGQYISNFLGHYKALSLSTIELELEAL